MHVPHSVHQWLPWFSRAVTSAPLMLLTGCAQEREHSGMHAGAHARRDGAPTCTHPCTRAHSEGRAPCLRNLRRVLLEPSPCVESPGEHEDEGLPYIRERTSRTNHMRVGAPTGEEAGAAIGCSMASTVLPYCPSSLLPHPAFSTLRGIGRVSMEKS